MLMQYIYSKLCNYDTRNPDGVISYLTKEEIEEEGWTDKAKEDCACDNCFYGRSKLAEHIIKLENQLNESEEI